MENHYDSKADTLEHIREVNKNLIEFAMAILERAKKHDESKLHSPEKEIFDKYTPILKDLKYGTKEYFDNMENIKPATDHHYKNNSHHPQFHEKGIDGMCLIDIIEMFADWKAATKRTEGGDILKSIEINKDRFKMSEQLVNILKNTW